MFVREISRLQFFEALRERFKRKEQRQVQFISLTHLFADRQSAMQNIKFNPHTPEKLLQFLQESDILTV